MLSISHLSHTYPNGTRALDDVTLEVPRGMFGLLGPNGCLLYTSPSPRD